MACNDVFTLTDSENAKLDVEALGRLLNNNFSGDTTTNRAGDTLYTWLGAIGLIGYQPPVAYASGVAFSTAADKSKTIEYNGNTYAPNPSDIPFTTSGTWAADDETKFYLLGYKASDLSGFVDTTTDQTIAGVKNFTGTLQQSGSNVIASAGTQTVTGDKDFTGALTKGGDDVLAVIAEGSNAYGSYKVYSDSTGTQRGKSTQKEFGAYVNMPTAFNDTDYNISAVVLDGDGIPRVFDNDRSVSYFVSDPGSAAITMDWTAHGVFNLESIPTRNAGKRHFDTRTNTESLLAVDDVYVFEFDETDDFFSDSTWLDPDGSAVYGYAPSVVGSAIVRTAITKTTAEKATIERAEVAALLIQYATEFVKANHDAVSESNALETYKYLKALTDYYDKSDTDIVADPRPTLTIATSYVISAGNNLDLLTVDDYALLHVRTLVGADIGYVDVMGGAVDATSYSISTSLKMGDNANLHWTISSAGVINVHNQEAVDCTLTVKVDLG